MWQLVWLGEKILGLSLCSLQAQLGAETAFPKGNAEHSEYPAALTSQPVCVSWLCPLDVLSCSINCVGAVIAHLLLGKKTSSDCFCVLYQMPELDVTALLLATERSEHLCISFLMKLQCILCFFCGCGLIFQNFSGTVASGKEHEEDSWWRCT